MLLQKLMHIQLNCSYLTIE